MFLHVHRNEVVRGVPRDNEAVNECWLSDRDRYSHEGLYAADRATQPMLRDGDVWRIATWDEALDATAEILKATQANDVGVLVHPATSNEEGASLAALGFANIDHRLKQLDFADDAVAEKFEMSVADIEKAKVVLLVGSNIRHEIPLLHQRLHKANKRGQKVFAINPVDFEFTFALAGKQIVKPSQLAKAVSSIAEDNAALFDVLKAAEGNAVICSASLPKITHKLRKFMRPHVNLRQLPEQKSIASHKVRMRLVYHNMAYYPLRVQNMHLPCWQAPCRPMSCTASSHNMTSPIMRRH